MARLVRRSVGVGLSASIALLLSVTSARAEDPPQVRDHRTQSPQTTQPQVRDHRKPTQPVPGDTRAVVNALTKAVNAAINGPEIKGLKVNGHEFIVKKAKMTTYSGTTTITGQISHQLTARSDDQVYYTINKRGDRMKLIKFEIQRGGVGSMITYPGKLFNNAFGTSVDLSIQDAFSANAARIEGSNTWENNAELIVTAIGLQARGWSPGGTQSTSTPTTTPRPRPTGGEVRDHRNQ